MSKKSILLLILFSIFLTCSVGASTWIIMSQQTNQPVKEKINLYFPDGLGLSQAVYYAGDAISFNATIRDSANAEYKDGGKLSIKSSGADLTASFPDEGSSSQECTQNVGSVTLTYTPNNSDDYNPIENISFDLSYTVRAVAYVASSAGATTGTYYGTVEQAIKAANSGTNGKYVYICESYAGYTDYCTKNSFKNDKKTVSAYKSLSALTIQNNTTIASGVTLCLPYDTSTASYSNREGSADGFADTKVDDNFSTNITIAEGKTLTNNGTLQIGGVVGHAGTGVSGQTSGAYAQITMSANATLTSSGTIECLGFIKEFNSNNEGNGSQVKLTGGTLTMPFVVYDYRGGTNSAGLWNTGYNDDKIAPFTRYDMPNLQTNFRMNYGATLKGYVDLYTASTGKHNTEIITIIGSSSAVINLKYGSFIQSKYTPKSSNNIDSTSTTEYGITELVMDGGVDLGSLSMKITVGISFNIEMSKTRFPVPFNFQVTVQNGDFNFPYQMKFMSGSSLTVNNATLTTKEQVIFYPKSKTSGTDNDDTFFDSNPLGYKYPAKGEAVLYIKGKSTVSLNGAFGGKIEALSAGAVVKIGSETSVTSYEATATGGTLGMGATVTLTDTITRSFSLPGENGTTLSSGNALYTSKQSTNGSYYWVKYTISFNTDPKNYFDSDISIDTLNLSESQFTSFDPATYNNNAISNAITAWDSNTSVKYYFAGWYLDSDYTTPYSTDKIKNYTDVTLYAKWSQKVSLTYTANNTNAYADNFNLYGTVWYKPGTTVSLPDVAQYSKGDLTKQYYFDGWTKNGQTLSSDTKQLTINDNTTIAITWIEKAKVIIKQEEGDEGGDEADKAKYTVSCMANEDGAVLGSFNYTSGTKEQVVWVTKGYYIKIVDEGKTIQESSGIDLNTATQINQDITITLKYYSSCIAAGTMITLADGTQKKVEDLTTDDILLVFNHETGEYEAAGIVFIENDGENYYNVINLTFSNGTITRLIYEHALFDITLNRYVYITESNYAEFIGHEFAVADGNSYGTVVLTNACVTNEYIGCYSLVTVYHLNYFIDGLFSIPGGIDGLFNIFEYGNDLKYDEEKMQADIEEYGLFTYEDFAEYIPEEIYEMFPAEYFKVAIGKGMLTFEDILGYIDQFIVKNGLI